MKKKEQVQQLLLEFSLEDNYITEGGCSLLLKKNQNTFQKPYFVDGVGFFVITNFKNRNFCHVDVYLIFKKNELQDYIFFIKSSISLVKERVLKTHDDLILLKFYNGEYSRFIFDNDEFTYNYDNNQSVKLNTLSYCIGIDIIKHSYDEIIQLGFWLSESLKNIIKEVKTQDMDSHQFNLYFYNMIISKLPFLRNYYKESLENLNKQELLREVFFTAELNQKEYIRQNNVEDVPF